jgi:two-component system chemotaxis response regulator CheB
LNAGPTKILVVDDSALYRQSISNVLREVAPADIVGVAKNGVEALEKIDALDPDLLTLDVQMPDMDGITVLREIKRRGLRARAIMVSSYTSEGAQVTTDALMEGAFDFILKPSSSDSLANRQQLRDALEEKIVAFREASQRRGKKKARRPAADRPVAANDVVEIAPHPSAACQAVIIGTSTGGPEALKAVLPKLPAELAVPVFVVQHMPEKYIYSLAKRLDEICELDVIVPRDGFEAVAGTAIIAPGGKQMKLERVACSLYVRVNSDPPENGVRPSVDYLIRSASEVLCGNVLAVILTGMGRDGLFACRQLKHVNGYVFAQSQDDCVVYGMPKAVIEEDLADRTLPLGKIAPAIVRHVKRSRRN